VSAPLARPLYQRVGLRRDVPFGRGRCGRWRRRSVAPFGARGGFIV